jgi:hypothetical protein
MPRYFKSRVSYDWDPTSYTDRYKVVSNDEDTHGTVAFGEVQAEVIKERSFPNFDFSEPSTPHTHKKVAKNIGVSNEYLDAHENFDTFNAITSARSIANSRGEPFSRDEGIHYAKSIKNLKNDSEFQPTELFTTKPKSVEIKTAHFDPSLNSSFLTVAAMIHQEHGVPLTSSHSLSKWSSAVSRNAKEKGLPVVSHSQNADMSQNNDINDRGRKTQRIGTNYVEGSMQDYEGFAPVPDQVVKGARQHLRSMLGREPKQHMSPQFNNVPLPGMENF